MMQNVGRDGRDGRDGDGIQTNTSHHYSKTGGGKKQPLYN